MAVDDIRPDRFEEVRVTGNWIDQLQMLGMGFEFERENAGSQARYMQSIY